MQNLIIEFFQTMLSPNSVWSVVLRGVVWFAIAAVIIISIDSPNPNKSFKKMKSNIGFLLVFIILSGILMYLLFGYTTA